MSLKLDERGSRFEGDTFNSSPALTYKGGFINERGRKDLRSRINRPAFNLTLRAALLLIFLFSSIPRACPRLEGAEDRCILSGLSVDRVLRHVRILSGFGTRFIKSPHCNESAIYIRDYLSAQGYNVSMEPFGAVVGGLDQTPVTSFNVVGFKPGSSSELAAFFAHYDSISILDPLSEAPGANDNAAGVAVLLEVARAISSYRGSRGLLFIFFSGEEVGMVGSRAWVKANPSLLDRLVAGVCLDGVGRGERGITIIYTKEFSAGLAYFAAKVSEELGHGGFFKVKRFALAGSDSEPFEEAGVKAVRLWDMDTEFIHTPDDKPETLDEGCLRKVLEVAAAMALKIARGDAVEARLPERAKEGAPTEVWAPAAAAAAFWAALWLVARASKGLKRKRPK